MNDKCITKQLVKNWADLGVFYPIIAREFYFGRFFGRVYLGYFSSDVRITLNLL